MHILRTLILACVALLACAGSASATQITIQAQQIPNVFFAGVSATSPPRIRVYYNKAFTSSTNEFILGGAPNGQGASNVYKEIITTWSAGTVSIPSFSLTSTDDALDDQTATCSFFWYSAQGAFLGPIQGLNSLVIYHNQASTIGCSPPSQCAFLVDLRVSNQGHIIPSNPTATYNTIEIDRKIAAVLVSATGLPDPGSNGILVRTTTNSVTPRSIAVGTDLTITNANGVAGNPTISLGSNVVVSASSPLSISSGTISGLTASGSQAGFLSSADWATFNGKQPALGFTAENVANKNASSGYAGLSGGKLTASQGQEVWSITDLTEYSGASGVGATAIRATISSPTNGQALTWDSGSSNWINGTPSGGTVTSVGVSTDAAWLTVGSTPVTTTGTITVNRTSGLTANRVLATPDSSTGVVGLRALVNGDLPTVDASHGGSGLATHVAYAVFAGSTSTTGNFQQVSGVGTLGQVLTSNGAGTLPTWQAAAGGTVAFLTATDAVFSPPIRGGIVTAQITGTPMWAQLALGAAGLPLVSNGTDAVYGQASLTAGVSGVLPIANGGTNATSANYSTNGVGYFDATRFLTTAQGTIDGSTLCLVETNGGPPVWGSCAGSAATAWSALTAPSGNTSVAMAGFITVFTWGSATGASDAFTFKDATGNSSASGHLVTISSIGGSTIKPVLITAQGTTKGVEMSTTGVLSPIGGGKIAAAAADITGTLAYSQLVLTGAVLNADLAGSIAYGKLSLTGAVLNADLAGSIAYSKLSLTGAILNADLAGSIADSKLLTISTAGKVSDSALSSNIPLLNTANVWAPTPRSSGSAPYLTVTMPADNPLTASAEAIGVRLITADRRHSTGALTTQREIVFEAPTYSFVGSSTITNAATLAVTGAPALGANAAITNNAALWLQAGKLRADDAGVVFDGLTSNLTNILALGTDAPARFGLSHGSSGSPVNTDAPTLSFLRFDADTTASGTVAPYFFGTVVKDAGVKPATYNLMGYVSSEDTSATNREVVATVGFASAAAGSTSRVWAFYGEATIANNATGQGAIGAELKTVNSSGVDSPAPTTSLPAGFTVGLNLTGGGGKLNSIGVNFQGGGTSAFKTGIHFPSDVIASGGYGIDFKYATRGTPLRLANADLGIVARNAADGADRSLLKFNSSNQVLIGNSGDTTVFGAAIRPGAGAFAPNTAQLYTNGTSQGLVITAECNSCAYDFLLAESGGNTLLRNAALTNDLEVATSGNVVLAGNNGAVTPGAAGGYVHFPSEAGAASGSPTIYTGYVPMIYDTTNHRMYVRDNGTWRFVQF